MLFMRVRSYKPDITKRTCDRFSTRLWSERDGIFMIVCRHLESHAASGASLSLCAAVSYSCISGCRRPGGRSVYRHVELILARQEENKNNQQILHGEVNEA